MIAPFAGLRVIELANWAAAPSAGLLLAEHGAEVIKVEPPSGDGMRGVMHQASVERDLDHAIQFTNRGKKSVALALNTEQGQELAMGLVATADVVITNLLPQRRERLNMTLEKLRAANPTAVIAVMTGFGDHGPDAHLAGFDMTSFFARSGLAAATQGAEGGPPRWRPASGDFTTGLALYSGIVTALAERERTGEGQLVETSLLRAAAWSNAFDLTRAAADGRPSRPKSRHQTHNPLIEAYECSDGRWVQLALPNADQGWPIVCEVIGRADLIEHPDYSTAAGRSRNSAVLVPVLIESIRENVTSDELVAGVTGRGGVCALVMQSSEVVTDEQALASGVLRRVEHHDGAFDVVAAPFDVNGEDPAPIDALAKPGGDTAAVLGEVLALSDDELGALAEAGVIGV